MKIVMCSIIFPLQIEAYYSDLDSDDPTVGTTSELLRFLILVYLVF